MTFALNSTTQNFCIFIIFHRVISFQLNYTVTRAGAEPAEIRTVKEFRFVANSRSSHMGAEGDPPTLVG